MSHYLERRKKKSENNVPVQNSVSETSGSISRQTAHAGLCAGLKSWRELKGGGLGGIRESHCGSTLRYTLHYYEVRGNYVRVIEKRTFIGIKMQNTIMQPGAGMDALRYSCES